MLSGHQTRGFSIIEVVIVLAIAGLIFMIVFISVPAVQREQRDLHRKEDLAILKGALDTWKANNPNNNMDTNPELQAFSANYFQNNDPSTGAPYTLIFYDSGVAHGAVPMPALGSVAYVLGHICGSDTGTSTYVTDSVAPTHGARKYAILSRLESNVEGACVDNR